MKSKWRKIMIIRKSIWGEGRGDGHRSICHREKEEEKEKVKYEQEDEEEVDEN